MTLVTVPALQEAIQRIPMTFFQLKVNDLPTEYLLDSTVPGMLSGVLGKRPTLEISEQKFPKRLLWSCS